MSRLRVVNLGLPKSGTTTLGQALGHAGLRVADWKIRRGQAETPGLTGRFVGELLYEGYFRQGDPLALMPEFDAFSEISTIAKGFNQWPQFDFGLLQALREAHPGVRFLLSVRPAADTVDSMLRWSNLGTGRLPNNAVPGLPAGYGTTPAELTRWVDGHLAFVRAAFGGAADFLEYDIRDPEAPTRIGAFLGRDLPWWGRANANTRRPETVSPDGAD